MAKTAELQSPTVRIDFSEITALMSSRSVNAFASRMLTDYFIYGLIGRFKNMRWQRNEFFTAVAKSSKERLLVNMRKNCASIMHTVAVISCGHGELVISLLLWRTAFLSWIC